jgi:hypothetical protein
MNLGDIRNFQVRPWLDDRKAPYRWDDRVLNMYIDQGVTEAVMRLEGIRDDSTTSICKINIVAGTSRYAFDPRIIEVKRVMLALNSLPLQRIFQRDLDNNVAGWQTAVANTPQVYFPDALNNTLDLYPKPLVNDVATINVLRLPLVHLSADTDVPEIEVQWHPGLAHWACHLAYINRDPDTHNKDKAKYHYDQFEDWFGAKKDVRDSDFSRVFIPATVKRRAFV